ncbi:MAG: thioredoxin domain-containing protein [Rhodospirillaceae bacterium]|nr:thioredoxin domain-containing protein [Rhodospirillaceae bacterium]MBT3886152.1 thioredoxin domain-containing protein [Rhodospirillaceae bacterium]MBT4118223.1 thioredoxin domain-containing protein [Rhodospirillaceae bacterium]MBT4673066.1 thioredoxin domain-containing protein [Rhodospirillaceae bacterium]MBT4721332.1 thioredoxin domain-containing protein [Rhodospirillaceae bacterium]
MPENLLGRETSPYLLQHKDNPVHWHPWGEDAFRRAAEEDRPVLLSIGYAACHWCHVMAHESFESEDIAALMNAKFVNIKLDREERPEIDTIYMSALAMMGQQGGWPLTMFLTPDKLPFYGGTYFPPEPRFGHPGFPDVLNGVADLYATQKDKVRQNIAAIKDGLERQSEAPPKLHAGIYGPGQIDAAAEQALSLIDNVNGGTRGAPKFPQPVFLGLLWRAYKRGGDDRFRIAVTNSLIHMSQGGIYDHLGGGYARYSTDEIWLAPHFEKMLYDNAQLIELLAQVHGDRASPLFEQRLRETIDWSLAELRQEDGPFAGTLDADSEGAEGTFYVWTEAEIDAALGADADTFKDIYDVTTGGNWEGKTILNRLGQLDLGDADAEAALAISRDRLLALRAGRERPGLDDKILTDWNGLMIAALGYAGAMFGEAAWINAAKEAFAFIAGLETTAGRLRHSSRLGVHLESDVIDDYAQMIRAALALYQATFEHEYLEAALRWTATANDHFWDAGDGGYYFSPGDAADVIVRTRTAFDNATPAGNGTMVENLARLYFLTGADDHRQRAEAIIDLFGRQPPEQYLGMPGILNGYDFLNAAVQVVVAGAGGEALCAAARASGHSNLVLMQIDDGAALPAGHPATGKTSNEGRAAAYVCVGTVCGLPTTEAEDLKKALREI